MVEITISNDTRGLNLIKNRRLLAAAAALAVGIGAAAGCSNQLNDQGGVPQHSPDYILTYLNVSDFPNITLVCIRGVGFATTTRDNNAAIQRVPEWDSFCATKDTGTSAAGNLYPTPTGKAPLTTQLTQTSP